MAGQRQVRFYRKATCKQCQTVFPAARVTRKYCTEACKQRAKRDRDTIAAPDPRACTSCGGVSIARDATGQESSGGAHVANTSLCWTCWQNTPDGQEWLTSFDALTAKAEASSGQVA